MTLLGLLGGAREQPQEEQEDIQDIQDIRLPTGSPRSFRRGAAG